MARAKTVSPRQLESHRQWMPLFRCKIPGRIVASKRIEHSSSLNAGFNRIFALPPIEDKLESVGYRILSNIVHSPFLSPGSNASHSLPRNIIPLYDYVFLLPFYLILISLPLLWLFWNEISNSFIALWQMWVRAHPKGYCICIWWFVRWLCR